MFFKPTTRLFTIKFLGLFGATTGQQLEQDSDSGKSKRIPSNVETPTTFDNGGTNKPSADNEVTRNAIEFGTKKIVALMLERGIPGLTICVSKKGQIVWKGAFGFCDVENGLECKPEAKMRIASISKSVFAATIIGKMIEQKEIDIDSSIHKYLSIDQFPKQKFDGQEKDITVKQLLSHTGGIKSYYGDENDRPLRPLGSQGSQKLYQCDDQYNRLGFYQRKTYRNVIDALEPIRDGPLVSEPGKYNYTSYGYTLLSAVAEKALHKKSMEEDDKDKGSKKKEQIEDYWVKVLRRDWDMRDTTLDQDEPILSNRARYYARSGLDGRLINAPYTDNSVKWAGGGLSSTTIDIVKFGMALIDTYKRRDSAKLKPSTLELLWTEVQDTYCLGFNTKLLNPLDVEGEKRAIYHTGGALGASSVLVIYPETEIVVAILTNLSNVNLLPVGLDIANRFARDADK